MDTMDWIAVGQAARMSAPRIVGGALGHDDAGNATRAARAILSASFLPSRHSASSRRACRGASGVNRSRPRGVSRTTTLASTNPLTARWIVESGLPVVRAISVRVAPSIASRTSKVDAAGSVRIDCIAGSIYVMCVSVKVDLDPLEVADHEERRVAQV